LLSRLENIDLALFKIINIDWSCRSLDSVMPLFTDQTGGMLVILAFFLCFAVFGRRNGRVAVAAALVTVVIIDPVGHYLLKPLFARARPCHLEIGRLLVDCGTGFAMPSLHSANSFGVFTPFVVRFRWKAAPLYLLSFIVAYSRVYVGVHWPADVLIGAAYGVTIGLVVAFLSEWVIDKKIKPGNNAKKKQ